MFKNLEDLQKYGKENVEIALQSFGAMSKGFQAVATELSDYSKKSFEEGTQAVEKLLGAKSLEKAIEVQQGYIKEAYEGFVSKATKLSEIYAEVAKETYKPFEGLLAKVTPAK
jgi:phasin family protein